MSMTMQRSLIGACAAAACWGAALGLRGENLLSDPPSTPAPKPADAPKPAEPLKPATPAPVQPPSAVPKPAEPETTVAIPGDGKRSRCSASQQVHTGPGVRIVKFSVPDKTTVSFDIELWVANGQWDKARGVLARKGERIGKRVHGGPNKQDKNFETSWKLVDIKSPKMVPRMKPQKDYERDKDGNLIKDANGAPVMKVTMVPDLPLKVDVIGVQHVWAKEKGNGKPVVRELEYPPPPEGWSLPDFPEDRKPPAEPSEEAP